MGEEYGYIRVSSKEQNVDRQVVAPIKEGIKTKYIFGSSCILMDKKPTKLQ